MVLRNIPIFGDLESFATLCFFCCNGLKKYRCLELVSMRTGNSYLSALDSSVFRDFFGKFSSHIFTFVWTFTLWQRRIQDVKAKSDTLSRKSLQGLRLRPITTENSCSDSICRETVPKIGINLVFFTWYLEFEICFANMCEDAGELSSFPYVAFIAFEKNCLVKRKAWYVFWP